jgi:hypothetical protein
VFIKPVGKVAEVVMVSGGNIVKLRAFDVPPPGAGLLTVTLAVPAVAMSLAEIDAVRLVALFRVVVRFDPSQRTVEPETKLEPLTVRVKAELPATADSGLIPVIAGTGFRIVRVNCLIALATG